MTASRLSAALVILTLASCAGEEGCPSDAPPAPTECGLNGRGTPVRVCEGSRVMDNCDDPDVCIDGEAHEGSRDACGFNDRGFEYQLCVNGQLEPACMDPDECEFNTMGISDVACGLNGRGRRPQTCTINGWFVNNLGCLDDDICVDGDSSSRSCGPNLRGTETTRCETGQWVTSLCELPSECLTDGSFDETLCPATPPIPVVPRGCPDLGSNGRISMTVMGEAREFLVYLPADPVGAPVAFLWHPLGGSASSFATQTDAAALARDEGLIVVLPEMTYDLTIGDFSVTLWRVVDGEPPDADLALFDDALGCLYSEHNVDLARIYSAGMSAGGLWTTRMLLDRADVLAAVAILSGGTEEGLRLLNLTYETPATPLPSMIAWGGDSDQLNLVPEFGLDFAAGSEALVQHRLDDGDGLVECNHGQGHTAPQAMIDFAVDYLLAHEWGMPSPYLGSSPPALATSCVVRLPPAP